MLKNDIPTVNFLKAHRLKPAVLLRTAMFFVSVALPLMLRSEQVRTLLLALCEKVLHRQPVSKLAYLSSIRGIVCSITAGLFLTSLCIFCLYREKIEHSPKLQAIATAITGGFSAMFVLLVLDGGNNWGGDFSEYIAQARAIITGTIDEQVKNNTYIIEHSSPIGDAVYPWGFPFLLAPFYALFGKSLFFLKLPVMLCFSVSSVFCVLLFRNHFSFFQAELLTLFVAANPMFINFCNQPLSDIPFLCFSLVTLYFFDGLFYTADKNRQIVCGIGSGIFAFLAFMTRTNGIVFPCLIAAMHIMYLLSKNSSIKSCLVRLHFKDFAALNLPAHMLPYILFALFCLIQNAFLPKAGMTHLNLYFPISPVRAIKFISYYCFVFKDFFPFRKSFFYAWFAPIFIYGFVRSLFRQPLLSIYFFGTMGILILAPFTGGIRYVFPVIPVMIVFTGYGIKSLISNFINKDKLERFAVFLEIISLFICMEIYATTKKGADKYGAYSSDAKEMYAVIGSQTEQSAKIIFFKPRVLYLETGRLGFQTKDIRRLNDADYLLLSKDGYGTFDYEIEQQYPTECENLQKLLENDTMKLYKIISQTTD